MVNKNLLFLLVLESESLGLLEDAQVFANQLKNDYEIVNVYDEQTIHCSRRTIVVFFEIAQKTSFTGEISEIWLWLNQEVIQKHTLANFHSLNRVLCKSQIAYEQTRKYLRAMGLNSSVVVHKLGFTSLCVDEFIESKKLAAISSGGFIHTPGNSPFRNSDVIYNYWIKNPELPLLTIHCKDDCLEKWRLDHGNMPKNVQILSQHLSSKEYLNLFLENPFHICPSQNEGFGHHLNLSRMVGAVMLITNAPPMNEISNSSNAILLTSFEDGSMGALNSISYNISEESLDKGIRKALSLNLTERKSLGHEARRASIENHKSFQEKISKFLKQF